MKARAINKFYSMDGKACITLEIADKSFLNNPLLDGSDIDFSLLRIDDPDDGGIDFANMHLLGMDTHIDNLSVEEVANCQCILVIEIRD